MSIDSTQAEEEARSNSNINDYAITVMWLSKIKPNYYMSPKHSYENDAHDRNADKDFNNSSSSSLPENSCEIKWPLEKKTRNP